MTLIQTAAPYTHWGDDLDWVLNKVFRGMSDRGAAPPSHTPGSWQDWIAAILILAILFYLMVYLSAELQHLTAKFLAWLEERGKNPVP